MGIGTLMESPRYATRPGPAAGPASIREVRLVGRRPVVWEAGDRVAWAGRAYRVADESGRCAHLRPEPGPDGAG